MKIFDLERQIQSCWNVVDDIEMLYKAVGDSEDFSDLDAKQQDKLMNILLGLYSLYALKFETCFYTFEEVTKEYHANRIKVEELKKRVEASIDHAHRQALK